MNTREFILKIIDIEGYLSYRCYPHHTVMEVERLIEDGTLIRLSDLPTLANFLNSDYKVTYADNRFDLYMDENNQIVSMLK